jgi:hypothetical protein
VPAKEHSVSARDTVIAFGLAGLTLVGASVNEVAAPIVVEETTQVVPLAPPTLPPTRSLATLPTFTLPEETVAGVDEGPRAAYAAATLPVRTPERKMLSLPTITPSRESESPRAGCDPSYPEERPCIPPGLPLDARCAITDERNFTLLPPDPKRLDADGDGIGCEPLSP